MEQGIKFNFTGDASGVETAATRTSNALGKVSKAAGNSSQVMINFNRVIQDAPYGLQGIANNIDPLVMSLGASGGLAFVVSLATSSLLLFGKELFDTSGQAEKSKKALSNFALTFGEQATNAKYATERLEEYNKMIDGVVKKNAEELSNVTVLVDRLKETNTTRGESVAIIKKLQDIAPDYFGKLNKETASVEQVTRAYIKYNSEITRTIETQVRIQELTQAIQERLDLSRQNRSAEAFINNLLAQGKSVQEIATFVTGEFEKQNQAVQQLFRTNKFVTKEQETQALTQSKIPFGVEVIISAMLREQHILDEINGATEKTLGITVDQGKAFEQSIRHAHIFSRQELERIQQLQDIIHGKLPEKTTAVTPTGPIVPSLQLPGSRPEDEERLKRTLEWLKAMKPALIDVEAAISSVGGAFESFFEAIFSGSKSAFAAFAQALGQIIKKLIATAAASLVLTAILGPLGVVKGATGAALKGFDLFKNIFGKLGGFAQGGVASGPQSGYPVMLHGTEVITPMNEWLAGNGGGGSRGFIAETAISGNDLRILVREADRRAGRIF